MQIKKRKAPLQCIFQHIDPGTWAFDALSEVASTKLSNLISPCPSPHRNVAKLDSAAFLEEMPPNHPLLMLFILLGKSSLPVSRQYTYIYTYTCIIHWGCQIMYTYNNTAFSFLKMSFSFKIHLFLSLSPYLLHAKLVSLSLQFSYSILHITSVFFLLSLVPERVIQVSTLILACKLPENSNDVLFPLCRLSTCRRRG